MNCKSSRATRVEDLSNGLVVDGYRRVLDGIEAEVRPEIEQKYAAEWNASGLVKRWLISRKIEKEIMLLVTERSKHVSPDALF